MPRFSIAILFDFLRVFPIFPAYQLIPIYPLPQCGDEDEPHGLSMGWLKPCHAASLG